MTAFSKRSVCYTMSTKEMKALVRESSSEGKQQRNAEMKKEGLE